MFRSISWSQFIQTIFILLAIYYPVIIFFYYRTVVMKYFTHGVVFSKQAANPAALSQQQIQPAVHELIIELNKLFKIAVDKKIIREELIMMLQKLISQYQQLKGSDIKNEISLHIKSQCKDKCDIGLSDEEIKMLWK